MHTPLGTAAQIEHYPRLCLYAPLFSTGRANGRPVWLAQLDPTLGSEIQKTRTCVVISPEEMNSHLRTVTPMTTGSRPAHFRMALTFQGKQGLIVLDQDARPHSKRMGALRPQTLAAMLGALQAMFAP